MKRFHTLPPSGIDYPYLLVNPRNWKELRKRRFELAILDCGVEYFNKNPTATEYPDGFLATWKERAKQLSREFEGKIWITIPDYPDDYHPGQGSIERTVRNIQDFLSVDGVEWLPSIQAKFIFEKGKLRLLKLHLFESIQETAKVIGNYPRVAVGSVCKSRNIDDILFSLSAVRETFPNKWIHAFGLTATSLDKTAKKVDSWDSMAWTFPREHGGWSAKNKQEQIEYFKRYINTIEKLVVEI